MQRLTGVSSAGTCTTQKKATRLAALPPAHRSVCCRRGGFARSAALYRTSLSRLIVRRHV